MPRPPGFLDTFNFVTFFASNLCETEGRVFVETALPAAGKTTLYLLGFDQMDLIRSFFRPKGLRSGRHGRKARRGKTARAVIPELSDVVASHIPGAEEMKNRKIISPLKTMWLIDNTLQRAFYYWMIADVVRDFSMNLLSGIIRDDRTNCPTLGRGLAKAGSRIQTAVGGWNDQPMGVVHYAQNGVGFGSFAGATNPGKWMGVFTATIRNNSDKEIFAITRIRVFGPLGSLEENSQGMTLGPEDVHTFEVQTYWAGDGNFSAQTYFEGGSLRIESSEFFVMQMGD